MRIGTLARQAGTTAHAIRFYEREGILPSPVRAANRYREYDEQDSRRLQLVVALRRLDVPLDEIRRLAGSCFDHRCLNSTRQLVELVERRSTDVDRQIAELEALAARLAELKKLLADDQRWRTSMTTDIETKGAVEERVRPTPHAECDCGCAGSGCDCGCACCLPVARHDRHRAALEVLAQPEMEACGCGCCE